MARAVASLGRAILRILAGRLRGSVEVRHPQIVKAGDAVRLGPHANPARAGEGPIFNLEQLALAEIDLEQRSEEHTSELQSLMRISYAVFCLKKKNKTKYRRSTNIEKKISRRHHNKQTIKEQENTIKE